MESKIKITLRNNFHNTKVNVFEHFVHGSNPYAYLTPRQVKRCQSELCGIKGCTCSDDLGTRPSESGFEVDEGGFAYKYVPRD